MNEDMGAWSNRVFRGVSEQAMDYKQMLDNLLLFDEIENMDVDQLIQCIGSIIDLSLDYKNLAGAERGLSWIRVARKRELSARQLTTLYYFEANCWHTLRELRREAHDDLWLWEKEETFYELINLRMALKTADEKFPSYMLSQIYTNLGNALDHIGRYVEAIYYWNLALKETEGFGRAIGNYGKGLMYYANVLYDEGHRDLFLQAAYTGLRKASKLPLEVHFENTFGKYLVRLEVELERRELAPDCNVDDVSMGNSSAEQRYRQWCLENTLFLNPLNDLGPYSIANQDILTCPDMVMSMDSPPYYHTYYNSLKQEYVSARWLAYEGMSSEKRHFSDDEVLLYQSPDLPIYGLHIQQVCVAFRMTYSLFDKIAYFLNDYLSLGIEERAVNFKTLWYQKQRRSNGLRDEFKQKENWSFRGLYWLSQDLSSGDPQFKEALKPDARDLSSIRNHLEHKHLQVTRSPEETDILRMFAKDPLSYNVNKNDFERMMLKLLRLARAALIYLSLGVHEEEMSRAKERKALTLAEALRRYDGGYKE